MVFKSWVRCPQGKRVEREEESLEIGQEMSPVRQREAAQR